MPVQREGIVGSVSQDRGLLEVRYTIDYQNLVKFFGATREGEEFETYLKRIVATATL